MTDSTEPERPVSIVDRTLDLVIPSRYARRAYRDCNARLNRLEQTLSEPDMKEAIEEAKRQIEGEQLRESA